MRDRITALREDSTELLAVAKEEQKLKSPVDENRWQRLNKLCALARELYQRPVVNLVPDESKRDWDEVILCLQRILEVVPQQ
jgi:hypothetical protein